MTNKIKNDKYYTPIWLAEYIYNKTKEICGDFTEIIEPSAGNGVFLDVFKENTIAYDLYPEDDRIIELDYLKNNLEYEKGRVVIGNPPFGHAANLAHQFIVNSLKHSDYVAFILPAGFYESDRVKGLLYTEYLDFVDFSNRKIKVCLNIYSREKYLNKECYDNNDYIDYLTDIKIVERRRLKKNNENYYAKKMLKDFDFAFCFFGSAIGKEIQFEDQYCGYFLFKSDNKEKINIIRDIIKNTNFKNEFAYSSMPVISKIRLKKFLNKKISEYYND